MLVEKTDRLYRNLKDWVTVDELDGEMPFPKEGVVLSRESRSSEKFMHGIKVLMAPERRQILSFRRSRSAGTGRGTSKSCSRSRSRAKKPPAQFLLSNCTWDHGKVVANLRQPFDMPAETVIETRA